MSLSSSIELLRLAAQRPTLLLGRKQYIFVLSHMRSFSSVLCHVLGSHPEIAGYTEVHRSYRRRTDLLRLRNSVYEASGKGARERFILDKILHNRSRIAAPVLRSPKVKALFLLRDPVDTLRSIINMGERLSDVEWYRDRDKVLEYYVGRLERLREYAELKEADVFFLPSERLLGETDCVLADLTSWLGLAQELSSRYETFKFTGVSGYGDPSETIKEGQVVSRSRSREEIVLPPEMVARAREAYGATRCVLEERCSPRRG